jgi:hypothetical protein
VRSRSASTDAQVVVARQQRVGRDGAGTPGLVGSPKRRGARAGLDQKRVGVAVIAPSNLMIWSRRVKARAPRARRSSPPRCRADEAHRSIDGISARTRFAELVLERRRRAEAVPRFAAAAMALTCRSARGRGCSGPHDITYST